MFYKVRLLIKSNKMADDCQIEYYLCESNNKR